MIELNIKNIFIIIGFIFISLHSFYINPINLCLLESKILNKYNHLKRDITFEKIIRYIKFKIGMKSILLKIGIVITFIGLLI